MSFYYNYTGQYPGAVNVNLANQTSPAKSEEPANPWLASPPKAEVPAQAPAPHQADKYFVYYPRYTQYCTAPVQSKPAEPVNPWLASPPTALKASTPHAPTLLSLLVNQTLTWSHVYSLPSPFNQHQLIRHKLLSITQVNLSLNQQESGTDLRKPRSMHRTPLLPIPLEQPNPWSWYQSIRPQASSFTAVSLMALTPCVP